MRKQMALLLAGLMVFNAAGCSTSEKSPSNVQETNNVSTAGAEAGAEVPGEKVVFRLAHNAAAGQPLDNAAHKVADEMYERTNGRVEIQVFESNILGSDTACRDMLTEGTLDLFIVGTGILGSWSKGTDLLMVPFFLESEDELPALLNSEWGDKYFVDPFLENNNARVMDLWMQGVRHYLGVEPVRTMEDFAGKKIRTAAGVQARTDAWEALKMLVISLGLEEAYSALESGMCDAVEMPLDFLVSYKYIEKAKYLTETSHQYYACYFMANEDAYQKLTPEEQQMFNEIVEAAGAEMEAVLDAEYDSYRKDMIDNYGVEFITLSDEEMKKIKDTIQPVYEKNMDAWGQECYDEAMAILEEMRK